MCTTGCTDVDADAIVDGLSSTDSLDSLGYEEYALQVTRHDLNRRATTLPERFEALQMFKIAQDCVDFNDINLTDVGAYEEFVSYRQAREKSYSGAGPFQIHADDQFPQFPVRWAGVFLIFLILSQIVI